MSVIRLPSWGEVLRGPWAIRLRSGGSGVWLMRGEADSVPELECRFLDSRAARTTSGALEELGQAFQLEVPLGAFDDLPDAVAGDAATIALLVLDTDRLLSNEPEALASLVGALRDASDRLALHVVFQARDLTPDAEAVLTEFGVAEIAA
ncbi:MAG TPA: hypothetical protein VGH82_09370 [Gaiellaceae bacterium]